MNTLNAQNFAFGPVELFVVEFDGVEIDDQVLVALEELGQSGEVHLVDLVVVARLPDDSIRVSELPELSDRLAVPAGLTAEGLIGQDDIDHAADGLRPGTGIALAALEMRWAKSLSTAVAAAGGHVAHIALIPASAVNELVAAGLAVSNSEKE